ncbi:helix-turn-helix transcriptional regulator [Actinomadura barringtoniae]|uniref:Helix-turn-helix transcriptional regulator n=1 Tax=Actinomadura barringtoniae TaxID=1427535 RepID=A0A939PKT3_9ACTN|nr:helix-turn-helix domain-containing protein [Actinomadura barringtoniae]MBO2454616.1 helix-turn-helix transcriptional regulator [Actinomadura barringtoniae]
MTVAEDTVARNRALQSQWYGEPLVDRFRRLLDRLGLSQASLASVLGLSAPMLSQLMSGQRAKISNPAVINRLLAVEELAADPGLDDLREGELEEMLRRIRAETATTTSGVRLAQNSASPIERSLAERLEDHLAAGEAMAEERAADEAVASSGGGGRGGGAGSGSRAGVVGGPVQVVMSPARTLQSLLRAVASASEIEAASALVENDFPELAELLRVYGNGRTSEAEAHFQRTMGRG